MKKNVIIRNLLPKDKFFKLSEAVKDVLNKGNYYNELSIGRKTFKTDVCPQLFIWEIERASYINCFINMSWNLNSLTFLTIKNYLKFLYQITNSFSAYTLPILIFTLSFILYFFKATKNYDNQK